MGYGDEARKIQDLYLDGKKDEAAAAVPTKLIEELALIGPADKIRHDLEAWRESRVTTILDRRSAGDAAPGRGARAGLGTERCRIGQRRRAARPRSPACG